MSNLKNTFLGLLAALALVLPNLQIRRHWVLFLIPGVAMVILGVLAAASPFVSTLVVDTFARWMPLTAGFVGLAVVFTTRNVPGFVETTAALLYRHIGRVLVLLMLLCCSTGRIYAADTLECPEIGPGSVPNLIGDTSGGGLFTTENRIDLANEINESINNLQTASPDISWANVQNVLIAAYCRVVARKAGLTAAEKWDRMRQFGSILERQIAANMMPTGSLIIANVPLPPEVYRELKRQAAVSSQTPSQLMTAILTRAAGK
jgi:hypothetical protein